MMKNALVWLWLMVGAVPLIGTAQSSIGFGANYWVTVDDIDTDNIDDNGFSYLFSYQYDGGLITLEGDLEVLPDRFGKDAYAPQAYALIGGGIYAGAGVGIVNYDGTWADDPFFALRAGLRIDLFSPLVLDVFGNYRFSDQAQLDDDATDIDTDTVFLGAAVRLEL